MGVHGAVGAGGAGIPSLPAAARLAAINCRPAAEQQPADQQVGTRRPTVRGGGPGAHTGHGSALHQQQLASSRLEQALHQQCGPRGSVVLPQLLAGGGPAQPAPPQVAAARAAIADPHLVELGLLLSDSPAEQPPSALRQLTSQLASLLASTTERVRTLLPSLGRGGEAPAGGEGASQPAAARVDAPALAMPLQPPPPPGPTLTLDPTLGTIVLDEPPGLDGERGTDHVGGDRNTGAEAPPTSWLPISGYRLGRGFRAIGSIATRVDALLRERGITRLQLLVLTLAAPIVVTIAIAIVDAILGGR